MSIVDALSPVKTLPHKTLRFDVDITTERIDFSVDETPRLIYLKEFHAVPGVLAACFEIYPTPTGHICPEPTKYVIVGRGYRLPEHYMFLRKFEMQDGLEWQIFVDLRE